MTRIAVGVSGGNHADALRLRRRIGRAVADALVRPQFLDADDRRAQRHDRHHANRRGRVVGKRRCAIEHDARAHEIAADLGIADHACGIGERARIGQPGAGALEHGERFGDAVVLVGAREVHHQAYRRDRRRRPQAAAYVRHIGRPESQPVHSGVDLDEDLERPRQDVGLQHAHLLDVVYNHGQPALREFRQLAFRKKPFEQQDAPLVVPLAQLDRSVELHQRETVGSLQRRQHPGESMPVGVGLDHRQRLRARTLRTRQREISPQCSEIDLGVERAGHPEARLAAAARRNAVSPDAAQRLARARNDADMANMV